MAVQELPIETGVAWFDYQISLDGVTFRLEFRWNDRDSAWALNIYDSGDVLLLGGIKIVLGFPLISQYSDPALPAGDFLAFDTSGTDEPPTLTDFGTRVELHYYEGIKLRDVLRGQ